MLYDHQVEFLNNIKQSIKNGNKRIMCVASCGFGKSIIIKEICDNAVKKNNNYMILVHRIELVNQLNERGLKAIAYLKEQGEWKYMNKGERKWK